MPKLTDATRLDRRRAISEAAARCFLEKGFDATTMSDIIKESGLSAGAIYVHYENKQDLVRSVVRDNLDDRLDELAAVAAETPVPPPDEVLRRLLNDARGRRSSALRIHSWSIILRSPDLAAIIDEFSTRREAAFAGYLRAYFEQLGWSADEAARRSVPASLVVIGLFQGFILQLTLNPALAPDALVDAVRWVTFVTPDGVTSDSHHPD